MLKIKLMPISIWSVIIISLLLLINSITDQAIYNLANYSVDLYGNKIPIQLVYQSSIIIQFASGIFLLNKNKNARFIFVIGAFLTCFSYFALMDIKTLIVFFICYLVILLIMFGQESKDFFSK